MEINILGVKYKIEKRDYNTDPLFAKRSIGGYHAPYEKLIVVCNFRTHPEFEDESDEVCCVAEKECMRHEILHAFFVESGLSCNSGNVNAWATNEEMVDWIAIQFPKIMEAYKAADCL